LRVSWKGRAERELFSAYATLREVNRAAAERWWADVIIMTNNLERLSSMGRRLRFGRDGDYRQTTVGHYRFIYRVVGDLVEIRRVRHVRRDYDPQRIRDGEPTGPQAFVPA
jgi:plasmid stabilization system protein ParE